MSTIEPGLILPATPVSASTRIAISRSPVELGRRADHALLQDRVRLQVRRRDQAHELRAVRVGRLGLPARGNGARANRVVRNRVVGRDRPGELEHDDLVADLGLDLRDVVGHEREHANQARSRKGQQQNGTSLSRIHPPPCSLNRRHRLGFRPER